MSEEVIPIIKLQRQGILANTADMAVNSAHAVAFHRGLGTTLHPTSSVPITKYLHEDDLRAFSKAAYAKPNFAVVANGASHDELSKWIGEFFNDSPAAPPKDFPPIETKPTKYYGGEERIAHDGGNNMIIGFPGSGAYTGGHYNPAIAVLSSLLGGQSYIKWSPGYSLLARATKAQTQAHVSTRNISYSDAGLLTISLGGNARHIREASEAIVEILKAISGGDIAKDDIKKAVAYAKFRTLSAGENTSTGLEMTGAGLVQSGKPSQLHGIAQAIDDVTEDSVKKVCIHGLMQTGFWHAANERLTGCGVTIGGQSHRVDDWRLVCIAVCGRDRIAHIEWQLNMLPFVSIGLASVYWLSLRTKEHR